MLPPTPEGLRPWREADAPSLVAAWADPSITRWNPAPADRGPDAARTWIAGAERRWARRVSLDLVVEGAAGHVGHDGHEGTVVGEVGLEHLTWSPPRAEVGVWIARSHRGRGHARRALETLTRWALDPVERGGLGLVQLWARTDPANLAAERLFTTAAGWDRLGPSGDDTIWSASAALLG